jgi:hypothetical protein
MCYQSCHTALNQHSFAACYTDTNLTGYCIWLCRQTTKHRPSEEEAVVSVTIDSLAQQFGLNHFDIIKLSIEGSEKQAST